ncbi:MULTISPECIES: threonine/serine exporter family protein [Psychrilyobacter]|uniref:Threonine/serine exporter n=1 Tax=Psychrilyobacter piezotolerans TaxID=2293438 RepID=A0ABX9KLJ2_9FUSO|nr:MULTISPECIES: threonine/serine exporter family protein [Psychrilyobacter]MCS5423075.1 threonine/serine exporter family protein [Psychrilyobacter sp. S5]NDI76438.1 threonine/serine exporter family protein [Psychrilyobacter piezotolerans]RDE66034.1 threonine/serine exporter [Psychrilyobacter sp. S5]REI43212.1 threonine/serine exporter [Psychrilyobacter piezotolerans]
MTLNKILKISAYAGKMILENGGETYRSEDIVTRICDTHGATSDCFATLSGIIVAVAKDDKTLSTVIRIKSRTVNLEKVHQINDLARDAKNYNCDEFMEKLKSIDGTPRYSILFNLLAHAVTAASFAILFGGTLKDFWGTLPIGAAVYLLSYSFSKYELNGIFVNTLGGAFSAFLAYYFFSIEFIDNIDKAIIGSLMLLVPGLALTNGIRDIIAGDYMTGMARGTEALLVATSLAVGTGAAISLCLGGKF